LCIYFIQYSLISPIQ